MKHIQLSNEVEEAKLNNKPVVVMESAGVFEGVPYPDNMKLAAEIENVIRAEGAVPAFTAIIDGVIKVGITEEEKEIIANPPSPLLKASRRDISILIVKKENAVTAVAAAMMIASMAGFFVVSGGGIGGVHRDYANSLDVSADLEEFSHSNVIVVCSGAKAILDLPFTMEYLETKSVPILGYRTNELPAYFCRTCGIPLHFSVESPDEVADIFSTNRELGINNGLLLTNPIDKEYAVDYNDMEKALAYALQRVKDEGIKGKVVTKFILDVINEKMGSESREAGRVMNINNAKLAAQVAVALNLR